MREVRVYTRGLALGCQVKLMANEEHLAILNQGVETWNAWHLRNPDVTPDFRGANLRGAELFNAS